jgi:hypothetical protein
MISIGGKKYLQFKRGFCDKYPDLDFFLSIVTTDKSVGQAKLEYFTARF